MKHERYRLLAAVIAASPDARVVGRTRLQKTVRILQSLGLPSNYTYMTHFYGPYSEEVQSDISLLECLHLVDEKPETAKGGSPYYVITARPEATLPEIAPYQKAINRMSATDATVLELAATFLSFREAGSDADEALERLRRKKGGKCAEGRENQALALLKQLRVA